MLTLDRDGAQLFPRLVSRELLADLDTLLSVRPRKAGVRISRDQKLYDWIAHESPLGELTNTLLGGRAQPVRAILFDKSDEANWALGWHQDRTIVVRERREVEGYGNWTVKAGTTHVEPPFALLEHMVTARVHLDDVGADNGPLLIVPGSHQDGRLVESEIPRIVDKRAVFVCLASAGDVDLFDTHIARFGSLTPGDTPSSATD